MKLDTEPGGSVTVAVSSGDAEVATASPAALTFTTGNWSAAQTVTVSGVADDDTDNGTATITHAVAGYDAVDTVADVSITVEDDDEVSVDLQQAHEGDIQELHSQFALSLAEVVNGILSARISGAGGGQSTISIAGQQIPIESQYQANESLLSLHFENPFRLDGDVKLTHKRLDDMLEVLSDSSFNVSTASPSPSGGELTLWGKGGKTSFDRNGSGRSIEGDLTAVGFGFEMSREERLSGLAYFRTRGKASVSTTLAASNIKSEQKLTVNSVYPYMRWQASEDVEVWATLGYGTGQVDQQTPGLTTGQTKAGRIKMLSGLVGTRVGLNQGLAFKSEVSALRTTTKGLTAAPMTSDQLQYKGIVEWSHTQALSGGGQLLPKLEAGLRYDDDSYATGMSMVLGGGVRFNHADGRWSWELGGSVLRSRSSKRYRERGVYGSVELRSESNGTGPSMSIKTSRGKMSEASRQAWDESAIRAVSDSEGSDGISTQIEFGYGMAYGSGQVKPKLSLTLPGDESSQVYETGIEYKQGQNFSLDLTLTHKPDADDGDGVKLGGSLKW